VDIVILALAYLFGSIPTGVLLSRTAGVDPRRVGSGNIGATNVARAAGRRLGLLTLIGDVLKGALPVVLAAAVAVSSWLPAGVALVTVLGHLFPCFLRFHGGKGVATAFGAFLVAAPLAAALSLLTFLVVGRLFRYVSLASIAAALTLPLAAVATGSDRWVDAAAAAVAVAIVARHHDNIQRLRKGTEPRFGDRSA
jgi:glycerol-3-phosphate acyltransferase PlsY